MLPGQLVRVLQGYFRPGPAPMTPALGSRAPSRPGIVQRAPWPQLPGMMPPARPGGGRSAPAVFQPTSAVAVQRAAAGARLRSSRLAPTVQLAPAGDVRATRLEPGQLLVTEPGRPLANTVRRPLEAVFGADFSTVRIHQGSAPRALGALAFTIGDDVYFAPGQYNPLAPHGLELLGHELAHVVQQRTGRVVNPFGSGVAVVQDLRLEREADEMARLVGARMWGWRAQGAPAAPAARGRAAQLSLLADSISIELVPPRGGAVTVTLTLTPELREAVSSKDKESFSQQLAAVLSRSSPGLLPKATKLSGLVGDLMRAIAANRLDKITVRLTAGTMTTLPDERAGSIYIRAPTVKKSAEQEMEEQYQRMLERAVPEALPQLGGSIAKVYPIGKPGRGEARVAIYSQGKRRKGALILYAHGYEEQDSVLPSTQQSRAFVFLVRKGVTLTRPDESVASFHAALPQLAEALSYPEVRAIFVTSGYQMPAFRLAYHDPAEVAEELTGLAPAMRSFDVGVLVFTRPNPIDKLNLVPPFGTSVPLNLVLDSEALRDYQNFVLHICRTPIVYSGGVPGPKRENTGPFNDVFLSELDHEIYTGRRFAEQMAAAAHLTDLSREQGASMAFVGELEAYAERQRKLATEKIPSYIV